MSDSATFELGKFTVRIGLRRDNPAFPVYLVFHGDRLVGKHFSRPGLSDCQWLERTNGEVYATKSCWAETSEGHPIWNAKTTTRRRGRPRKDVSQRELEEALAA